MKLLREIVIVLLLLAAGILLGRVVPFPSSLISMLLFLGLLLSGLLKEENFKGGLSDLVLKYLSVFFIPPSMKVLDSLALLEGVWPRILLVVLISNVLIMGVTGLTVQLLLKTEHQDA